MNHLSTIIFIGFILSASTLFSGCSAENFKRASYEANKNYQCNNQIGTPDCRDNYPSYEEYQREREETPK